MNKQESQKKEIKKLNNLMFQAIAKEAVGQKCS